MNLVFKSAVLVFLVISFCSLNPAHSAPRKYKSAILMEAETGKILFARNIHRRLPPASMVKMMLALIVMEKVKHGEISLSEKIKVSRHASMIGGSQVYLKEGEVFTLRDMMKAIMIKSACDVAVAVSEHISGSTKKFLVLMNKRASELKMNDTIFKTTNGLPKVQNGHSGDMSSAYDMAILARELVKYPTVLEWTNTKTDTFRNGKFILTNTNKLLKTFPELDGLKTGYYRRAGWSFTATAKKGDMRLISVVMGSPTKELRFDKTKEIMDMGFKNYTKLYLMKEEDVVFENIPVIMGDRRYINGISNKDITLVIRKSDKKKIVKQKILFDRIQAPVKKGQRIGCMLMKLDKKTIAETSIIADENVDKISRFRWLVRRYIF
ncbi:MAG: D-alanyl-D-alanine carboxypeptidase family protein [bacterium]|nr:D-alanyl-D-alanine carboxypeptidase family protein [bacterium]